MVGEESRGDVAGDGEAAGEAGGADTSDCDPASAGVHVNHVILYVFKHTPSPLYLGTFYFTWCSVAGRSPENAPISDDVDIEGSNNCRWDRREL